MDGSDKQPEAPGDTSSRGRSAGLVPIHHLASNNPFRPRGLSPSNNDGGDISPPLASPFDDPTPPPRPTSRNPFLDPTHQALAAAASRSLTDKKFNMAAVAPAAKPEDKTAEELFDSLNIDDKGKDAIPRERGDAKSTPGPGSSGPGGGHGPRSRGPPMSRSGGPPGGPPRPENMPPRLRGLPPGHRPSRSQEEAMRARRPGGGRPGGVQFDPTSPQRRAEQQQRPRRNSDSSLVDSDKPLTDEEKKAREARRKDRERRAREAAKAKPVNKKLDIIDQLDATSIFGTGLFHHDGPFDALNPHRNRKGSRRAPMQAFPKDSLNNSIGGPGPVNARPDHATFMGNAGEEAFKDYASGSIPKEDYGYDHQQFKREIPPVFDPLSRGSILHGTETLGLGTSTFLEGTPATKTAIQKKEMDARQESMDNSLRRNKSIAQRIRGVGRPGSSARDFQPSGRLTNPDGAYYTRRSPDEMPAGPSSAMPATGERNPFFDEFDGSEDVITVAARRSAELGQPDAAAAATGPKSPTSPKRVFGLERRATTDAPPAPLDPDSKGGSGGGLLARVKSLKGGRKPEKQQAGGQRTSDRLTTPPGLPGPGEPTPPGAAL